MSFFGVWVDILLTVLIWKGVDAIAGQYIRLFRRVSWDGHLLLVPTAGMATFAGVYWVVLMVDKYALTGLLP